MTERYRVVIVEDESLARQRLRKLLSVHNDRLEIIGEAKDGDKGKALIESMRPDVVFLDIQMPVMDGFEMLKRLTYPVRVIFTTAFDQYAIQAFEENSVDYLLKPIREERLARSIEKLASMNRTAGTEDLERLFRKWSHTSRPETLTVKLGNKMILLPVEEIAWLCAEDKYVVVHCRSGEQHLINLTLTELEQRLPGSFVRIHRSYIIHTEAVREIRRGSNGKLDFVMNDPEETVITSSQNYTPAVRRWLGL